jgi:hypothetical protein
MASIHPLASVSTVAPPQGKRKHRVTPANACGITGVALLLAGYATSSAPAIFIGIVLMVIAGILEGGEEPTQKLEGTSPSVYTDNSPEDIEARTFEAENWAERRLAKLRAQLIGGSR